MSLASTNMLSRSRVVAHAAAVSAGSGANCSPRWSGSETTSKPRSSASLARDAHAGPSGAPTSWTAKRSRRAWGMDDLSERNAYEIYCRGAGCPEGSVAQGCSMQLIGIDAGGTFTDTVVATAAGNLAVGKALSTPGQ